MAELVPQRAFESSAAGMARCRVAALPHEHWLPPLLVVIAALAAMFAGYSARPATHVILGDYYASIYLRDFHAREIAATAAATRYDWPVDAEALRLTGGRSGYWLATLRADEALPPDVLRLAMLSVNGERIAVQRRAAHEFTAIIPPELSSAPQLELRLAPALTGDPVPPVGTLQSVALAPAYAYRWTQGTSELFFPALGRGGWRATVDAILLHPDGVDLEATVQANGVLVARLPNTDAQGRRMSFTIPAELMPDGDLRLTFTARTYADPRPLGILIEQVELQPQSVLAAPPPLGASLLVLVIALGGYVVLQQTTRRPWPAALVAILVVGCAALVLREARYPLAFMLPGLAGLVIGSLLLVLLLERLLPWALARAAPAEEPQRWFIRGLLLIFVISLWAKAGGMLYPYFVGIDVSWHMDRARWILGGQLPLLYGINSPLNESTMPIAEWGASPPVIPYSPWFHILAAGFSLLPLPMELTGNMISALLDSSRVLLIAILARACGLGERGALFAGLLYAVTPATFLLHSWGNLPTTYGMWCTLAATVYFVVGWRRIEQRGVLIGLIALLTVTLLVYTVMAVFMLVFPALLGGGMWMFGGQAERRRTAALALASALALGAAIVVYYGQYISPVIERTIPYFLHAGDGEGVNAVQRESFGEYLAKYWPRMGYLRENGHYGMQLPLLLGLLGVFLVRGRRMQILLVSWLVVGVLFLLAGSRISMVDKHLFFILPVLVIGTGAILGRLWRRGMAAQITIAVLAGFSAVSALGMWLYRIVSVKQ
ncbi:MAG TPA: hypothetical protein PKA05_15165 [Roseiflexaceae bacterium]|nr:hypothetical protein [Roseiflexaceae bacterium]